MSSPHEIHISDDVEEFIESLQKPTVAKVLRSLELLEEYGKTLGMPHVRAIQGEVSELRIRGKQEIRLFFFHRKTTIVVIHGYQKKSQKLPVKELRTAIARMKNFHI